MYFTLELGPVYDKLFRGLYDSFATPDLWAVDPDSHQVLKTLTDWGLKLAIVSNFDERLVSSQNTPLLPITLYSSLQVYGYVLMIAWPIHTVTHEWRS